MALRQIQRRSSSFILDAFRYSKNDVPRNPIQRFSSEPSEPIRRFNLKNREYDEGWFHNSKGVGITLFLFSAGAAIGVSSGKWIKVPYTERNHFVLFHKFMASQKNELSMLEGEPLDSLHQDSTIARRIFQDIIDQARPMEPDKVGEEEIVVVDSPETAITCARFAKICLTTGLLDLFGNDESMTAAVIGHEVGRDLARHYEELCSKFISSVSITGMSLYLFFQSTYIRSKMPHLVREKFMRRRFLPSFSFVGSVALLSYLIVMKYCREMKMEADYIGMILASSAGYSPLMGLLYPTYEKESKLPDWFLSSPSGRKRSLRLLRPEVLYEAVLIYREKHPDDKIDSS